MKRFLLIPLAALALVGCNAQAQQDLTVAATFICSSNATLISSGLTLNANETAAVNSVANACAATAQGTNLTSATVVAAIFAGAVTLQQSGILNNLKLKALAPGERLALRKLPIDQAKVDWFLEHNR